ncbi:MAG: ABC transporter ATP-binding protein [Deltaproteobacteria bacterium RBG_13_43_22]|nr:MAG: ABC transporter ATP-binding protein [Deltaproteobacteria bacterium RBG_13_43_22]
MIRLINIHKSFRSQQVLRDLSLTIPSGQTTVIIGRSGGGKSVLLKHIMGLIRPDSGEIWIDDQEINQLKQRDLYRVRKRFGMLFQEGALFDSMSVGENVAFPIREHKKMTHLELEKAVSEKLALVGLSGIEKKMPSELSGGMRKRVALARAMALDPDIMLFDEPTTGLDPILTAAIDHLIIETQKRFQMTCVVISHDIQSVFRIAHNIVMLFEGKIIEGGTPEVFRQSTNKMVQDFLLGQYSENSV